MPDNNLPLPPSGPVETAPTESQLVDDLSELLDNSPASANPVENAPAEAAPVEDDPLGLAEDEDQTDAEEPNGPDGEIKGGRFAPDSAKVKLDDGTTISIAELKRNNLYHAGFTQKTQELSKEREAFDTERRQVAEYAQSLDQSREYLSWYAEQHIPKQPKPFEGDARLDPQGFLEWQQEVSRWQTHVQAWQQFQAEKQADGQRKAGETQQQQQQRLARERDALLNAIPVLKDPVKGKQVWDAIVNGASQHYGVTPEEVNSTADHRFIQILRDAIAYRRIKAAAPQAPAEIRKPVIRDGRRTAPGATATREKQARTERLRNSGSFEDGVAALQDFDL